MMASSTKKEKLLQIFRRRIEWKMRPELIHEQQDINDIHLLAVLGFVLELSLNSEFFAPISAILWDNEDCLRRLGLFNFESFPQMITSLTLELQKLFMVPKLLDKLKKTEIIAAFIDFLVQLISHGTCFFFSIEDRIKILNKELRFLVVVLEDVSLLGAENEIELVENFLAEFEAVTNEAGSFVYSLLFATDIDKSGIAIGVLLEQIELLKVNIIKFSSLPPSVIKLDITVEAAAVDSSSIILSLLRDLEELLNQEDNLIVYLKGQIKILHQGDGDQPMQNKTNKTDPLIMNDGPITRARSKKIKEAMMVLVNEVKDQVQEASSMGQMMNIIQVGGLEF